MLQRSHPGALARRALLGVPVVALACVDPASRAVYPTDQAGYNAAIAPAVATANARQQASWDPVVEAGSTMPIATVDASQAPPLSGGHGFFCARYEVDHGETAARSRASVCTRTVADCRSRIDALAGGPGEPRVHVGACERASAAWCTYRWIGRTGAHVCARDKLDCQGMLLASTHPGGPRQQSACHPVAR